MALKDEVEQILSRSLRGSPPVLRHAVEGGEPPTSEQETLQMLLSVTLGLREALLLIAERLDDLDDPTRGN